MIWTIIAVILVLIKLVVGVKRVREDDDPVWQTVVAVESFCDEIARWETNLWSLWAIAVIENLLFRLDESDRLCYLRKLENQIIEMHQKSYEKQSMSEKGPVFPYFEQETTDSPAH